MKKIELTQGKVALVDDEDFEMLSQYKWTYQKHGGYASRNAYLGGGRANPKRKTICMHTLVMDKKYIDHINGNGLDNRKTNLRSCTHAQNMRNKKLYKNNKSGYKGVYYSVRDKKFQANIRVNKILKHLGYFTTAEGAAEAYNTAASKYFGEFARINTMESK